MLLLSSPLLSIAQSPELDAWDINTTGKTSSYYMYNSMTMTYTFVNSSELADVQSVCYTNDSMWIKSTGMTNDMGKFSNPGAPSNQNYVFRLPRNPVEATVKSDVPTIFTIGVLINGIPLFGKGDGTSWDAGAGESSGMGDGLWNGEAWYGEGESLDTAFAAHPQADGAYHTHASPFRLYDFPSSTHSPIIGFGIDGVPIYGPYGYSNPTDAGSVIKKLVSGYELRNITQRHSLPDGTVLSPSQYGPDVDATHPLGEFSEDYEYTGIGDLDEYNGRFCYTPEYPAGTYAYFIAVDDTNGAAYPYFIGNQFYGEPEDDNNNPMESITQPGTTDGCVGVISALEDFDTYSISVHPNPTRSSINISGEYNNWVISDLLGNIIDRGNSRNITLDHQPSGIYIIDVDGQAIRIIKD